MQTLNQSLFSLYQRRMISLEEAQGRTVEPDEFRMMIDNAAAKAGGHPSGMHPQR
jgi:twitching motility protein PilT